MLVRVLGNLTSVFTTENVRIFRRWMTSAHYKAQSFVCSDNQCALMSAVGQENSSALRKGSQWKERELQWTQVGNERIESEEDEEPIGKIFQCWKRCLLPIVTFLVLKITRRLIMKNNIFSFILWQHTVAQNIYQKGYPEPALCFCTITTWVKICFLNKSFLSWVWWGWLCCVEWSKISVANDDAGKSVS